MNIFKLFLSHNYNENHNWVRLFGIKLNIKRESDKKKVKKFINHKIPSKTILIVEANICHNETIVGYTKYFNDLGYNVEVLRRIPQIKGALERYDRKIKIWTFKEFDFNYIMSSFDAGKYERIIYNSRIIYAAEVNDYAKIYPKHLHGQKESIYIQHHLECLEEANPAKQLILANPQKDLSLEKLVVNPHYYGKVKYTSKNKITKFITVGDLSPTRRNLSILLSGVEQLVNKGITNFKVAVIGNLDKNTIPKNLQKFFEVKEKLDFPQMYAEMEKSDFFLPLLDPENNYHERYLQEGTSGSFQLIYGFLKPCIIHKTFAEAYNFSIDNSLIYETNENCIEKLEDAINMNKEEYNKIQNHLKELVNQIEAISVKNLKEMIND